MAHSDADIQLYSILKRSLDNVENTLKKQGNL